MRNKSLFTRLESRFGSAKNIADLLKISEKGSYYAYRRNSKSLPPYIKQSMKAHLLLDESQLARLTKEKKMSDNENEEFSLDTIVTIGCPIHGDFEMRAGDHIGENEERIAYGCPKCGDNKELSDER
tara:strand:+ start:298 stop:678 length:381 start_codon:yes stop_codon:yes gene_type:complete